MSWKESGSRAVLCAALGAVLFSSTIFSANNFEIKAPESDAFGSSLQFNFLKNIEADEYEIFGLINRERRRKGLAELVWDDQLARMARSYSRKMAKESFFSHFDGRGKTVVDRARDSDIRGWRKIGENLF